MSEPTSTTVAGASVATGALTLAGSVLGIPADALLASVIGAALALGQGEKVEMTRSAGARLLYVFTLSLSSAIFLGPLTAHAAVQGVSAVAHTELPLSPFRAALCFLIALGAQKLLPSVVDVLASLLRKKA